MNSLKQDLIEKYCSSIACGFFFAHVLKEKIEKAVQWDEKIILAYYVNIDEKNDSEELSILSCIKGVGATPALQNRDRANIIYLASQFGTYENGYITITKEQLEPNELENDKVLYMGDKENATHRIMFQLVPLIEFE